jgi:23S rRNA (adenine2030-N6)-methyltransferase
MFSYRHAFHAGNHADVLKHVVWVAVLRYLLQKDAPLSVIDTHAGVGAYRLDGEHARTSGEALGGVLKLFGHFAGVQPTSDAIKKEISEGSNGLHVDPLIDAYMAAMLRANGVAGFGKRPKTGWMSLIRRYPGSPLFAQTLLRAGDRMRLFELHPTDAPALAKLFAETTEAQPSAQVHIEDGFDGWRKCLPPPKGPGGSKRAVVLMDPSYEIKTDYIRTAGALDEMLQRFPTGVYVVWHPLVARTEAHALARKLRALATAAKREWVHATLDVGESDGDESKLRASGMLVVNPPYTLHDQLAQTLPVLRDALAVGNGAAFSLHQG